MSKIVVIDDSQAELQLIESYLKAAHHTVVTFSTTDKLEEKIVKEGQIFKKFCFDVFYLLIVFRILIIKGFNIKPFIFFILLQGFNITH